jgi:hypothetical protein
LIIKGQQISHVCGAEFRKRDSAPFADFACCYAFGGGMEEAMTNVLLHAVYIGGDIFPCSPHMADGVVAIPISA